MLHSTLHQDYIHIFSGDPAIDTKSDEFDHPKFCATGDYKYLPLKQDAKPSQWKLRHLEGEEIAFAFDLYLKAAEGKLGHVQLAYKLVALALIGCEDVLVDDSEPLRIKRIANAHGFTVVDPEQMSMLMRVPGLVTDMAARIAEADLAGDPLS